MKKIFLLLKLNLIFFIAVIFIPIAQRFELLSSAPDSTQVRNRSITSVPCHNIDSLVNSINQLLVLLYTQSTDQFLWLVINIIHQWINLLQTLFLNHIQFTTKIIIYWIKNMLPVATIVKYYYMYTCNGF